VNVIGGDFESWGFANPIVIGGFTYFLGDTLATQINQFSFRNTAYGHQAAGAHTTGDFNTAYGYLAMGASTGAQHNTAIGSQALAAM
jgi:hypothetical protein